MTLSVTRFRNLYQNDLCKKRILPLLVPMTRYHLVFLSEVKARVTEGAIGRALPGNGPANRTVKNDPVTKSGH